MDKICEECGKKYIKTSNTSMKQWEKSRTCNRECFHKRHKKLMVGHQDWGTVEGRKKQQKNIKESYRSGRLVPWNNGKENKELKNRWKTKEFRKKMIKCGEKSPSWKGENIDFIPRHRARYYRLKHRKCELCGKIKRRMHIHHIDGNIKNNKEKNLMFLCPKCHMRFHPKNMKRDIMGRFVRCSTNERINKEAGTRFKYERGPQGDIREDPEPGAQGLGRQEGHQVHT